jgi:hypothetical protein
MQFSDIKFIERDGPNGSATGLYIAGYWVHKYLFESMWLHAEESLPRLDWSRKQTSADVFGDRTFWLSHRIGERISLGRCLKYFVQQGMLPIREANPGRNGPRRYVRN